MRCEGIEKALEAFDDVLSRFEGVAEEAVVAVEENHGECEVCDLALRGKGVQL
jgi:hypothetical protein